MTEYIRTNKTMNIAVDTRALTDMAEEYKATLLSMDSDDHSEYNGMHFWCDWNTINDEEQDEDDRNAVYSVAFGPVAFTVQMDSKGNFDAYDFEFVQQTITFTLDELLEREW